MTSPDQAHEVAPVPGFWTWLIRRDIHGDRGLANIVNKWLIFHLVVGGGFAYFLDVEAEMVAKTVALPGAAILVGLAFGWAGRSASLLQDKNFSEFLIQNGPPPDGYVYSFQLAILAVLVFIGTALILVVGGFGITSGSHSLDAVANRVLLFTVGSIAVRESWGIIYFVNKLTILYYRVREQQLMNGE